MDNIYEIWDAILSQIEGNVSEAILNTWIKCLTPDDFKNDCLILQTSSDIKKEIFDSKFKEMVKKAALEVMGFEIDINVIIKPKEIPIPTLESVLAGESESVDPYRNFPSNSTEPTFANFIVGPTNQFAYVAAEAVSRNPGQVHNPLFIYGESGLGKTHLLKAIKNSIQTNMPHLNILFTSGENFLNEMISHITDKRMSDFHKKYRSCDVLLMDDIQFIGKTNNAQEEFFYTFDALINQGKQIVLTSDRPPKDIPTLTERLRSRFVQGLLADIQPPMLETRMAIIRSKSLDLKMLMPDDVVEFIAERLKNNVRQIEGVVNRLHATYLLNNHTAPSIVDANNIIKDIIYYAEPTEVTINNIIDKVAEAFGVLSDDIRSERKKNEIVNARQFTMYIMREVTNLTYEEIGTQFGKKHSTVIYSIEAAESKMEDNAVLKNLVYEIMKSIKDERIE